jgi:alkaline phosphatase
MVEGSQMDWRGHDNAPLGEVIAELSDFNGAIAAALAFQEQRPNTLVVVTADHETGGLALHYDQMGVFRANYTTDTHTAGMVPLFARGPGAAAFTGIRENDAVGRLLLELVRENGETFAP